MKAVLRRPVGGGEPCVISFVFPLPAPLWLRVLPCIAEGLVCTRLHFGSVAAGWVQRLASALTHYAAGCGS